jgi:hypothetical protein
MQPKSLRVEGQRFDVARHRVVAFVAVHVHPQTAFGRQFAEDAHALGAVGHRALEVRDAADRVHADWQRQPGCGRDAMCDQITSTNGVSCGSRYYPRGVTAWLWLNE